MVNIVGEISNKEPIGLQQMYTFESFFDNQWSQCHSWLLIGWYTLNV